MNTSEIAKIAGVHPNTVRKYDKYQLISPVPRKENGYRNFSKLHLNQVLLINKTFKNTWFSGVVRETALNIIKHVAKEDFNVALSYSHLHLKAIKVEKEQAIEVIKILENYDRNISYKQLDFTIGKTAELLGLSIDKLRDWERNNLITVPRNKSGYRIYGEKEISRLKIIKEFRKANYSTIIIMKMLNNLDEGKEFN